MDGQWAVVDRAAAVQIGREHEDRVRDARLGVGEDVKVRQGNRRVRLRERAQESRMQRRRWGVHAARVSMAPAEVNRWVDDRYQSIISNIFLF